MSMALPIAASRRGACPSLDAPMQTGDGLLARIRVSDGRVDPSQLAGIASAAAKHGNGLVEVTARGNLQVRGLTPVTTPSFATAIRDLVSIETGLVVETPPLAGDDPKEIADPRAFAAAIRAGAASLAHRLGPKVTVIVDGHGQLGLDALKADIRLVARDATHWSVTLGNAKPQLLDAEAAHQTTIAVLSALAALGPEARASDLFAAAPDPQPNHSRPERAANGTITLRRGHTTTVALPFGQMEAAALTALATAATDAGVTTIRLAPHHTLLLDNAPEALIAHAATLGFITDPADPRRRISACIGSAGCASGHLPARVLATELSARLPDPVAHLHVSGCAKGCAHPRRAALTLVGRADGYGLVISGRAGDTPAMILAHDQIESAIARAGRPE